MSTGGPWKSPTSQHCSGAELGRCCSSSITSVPNKKAANVGEHLTATPLLVGTRSTQEQPLLPSLQTLLKYLLGCRCVPRRGPAGWQMAALCFASVSPLVKAFDSNENARMRIQHYLVGLCRKSDFLRREQR